MDIEQSEVAKEVAVKLAQETYVDIGKPVAKPTGELLALVPRAIKAALQPLEKWIITREYNIKETEVLLEQKLKNVPYENIQSPEAYIAVPALQGISYCMDNEELRNMYACLLANSMNNQVKSKVHPGFVEIIKQLCPDEAKIIKEISLNNYAIPLIDVEYYTSDKKIFKTIVNGFSDIGEIANCENPLDIFEYINNLCRLGLLYRSESSKMADDEVYDPIINHEFIVKVSNVPQALKDQGFSHSKIKKYLAEVTPYGKNFCKVCIG